MIATMDPWRNRDTRDAFTWLGNGPQGIYTALMGRLRRDGSDALVDHLRRHGMTLIAECGAERDETGRLDSIDPDSVDWSQVVDALAE